MEAIDLCRCNGFNERPAFEKPTVDISRLQARKDVK